MATYKVIQDIEAEDKLLGPLTLRQFIYGAITVVCLYFSFVAFTKHAAFLLVVFLPIAVVSGFFAFPWGRDQPTEVWALAKVRFVVKPHRRIWDQSGVKQLVTITAPKRPKEIYTNGLSQAEVRSRLEVLAKTIDTRGWATKNVNVNLFAPPIAIPDQADSDRLVNPSTLPKNVPDVDIHASEDVFDEKNNPTAQHFEQMITTSSQTHRQQLVQQLQHPDQPIQPPAQPSGQSPASSITPDYWFVNQGTLPTTQPPPATTSADEAALNDQLKRQHEFDNSSFGHMRVIPRPGDNPQPAPPPPPVTPPPNPAILAFANNNDLNVATIARQANEVQRSEEPPADEVVITLH